MTEETIERSGTSEQSDTEPVVAQKHSQEGLVLYQNGRIEDLTTQKTVNYDDFTDVKEFEGLTGHSLVQKTSGDDFSSWDSIV